MECEPTVSAAAATQDDRMILKKALESFSEIVASSKPHEDTRRQLAELHQQVNAAGVHGQHALDLLAGLRDEFRWEMMDSASFGTLYRFAFWVCRDPAKRNLPVERALVAWELLLNSRFRLLDKWIAFLRTQTHLIMITEDTWRQVLDFTRSILGDLSNYDPAGAWPVLLDEFVEHQRHGRKLRHNGHSTSTSPLTAEGVITGHSFERMVAVSPSSGSKRRGLDLEGMTTQMSQLLPMSKGGLGMDELEGSSSLCGAAKRLCLEGNGVDCRATAVALGSEHGNYHHYPDFSTTIHADAERPWIGFTAGEVGWQAAPRPGAAHFSRLPSGSSPPHHSNGSSLAPVRTSSCGTPTTSNSGSMSEGNSPTAGSTASSGRRRSRLRPGVGLLSSAYASDDECYSPNHQTSVSQILQATVMEGLFLEDRRSPARSSRLS